MVGPIEVMVIVLFLLGCYGLAIGILQVLGLVSLEASRSMRFLGASGLGNIAGGFGALGMSIVFALGRVLDQAVLLALVAAGLGLVGLGLVLSEHRRSRPRSRR